ncbi:MAG TPA: hypothetical protein VLJ60_02355 [bacterium]|nr:hypothetical protein [bacterium]
MNLSLKNSLFSIIVIFTMLNLSAADTVETFDPGASNFEFYVGYDGIGLDKNQGSFSAEAVAGFGITERFSALISLSGESNEYFANGSGNAGFGIFGTVVDTDFFDFDLFLNSGIGTDSFSLAPAIEINIDFKPDLELAGLYFRIEEVFAGRDESTDDKEKYAFAAETGLTAGFYYSINEKHQLLLEYDMALLNNPAGDEDTVNIGGIALGYNAMIHENIELISQVYYDIPQNDEKHSFGVSVGIIATLPGR